MRRSCLSTGNKRSYVPKWLNHMAVFQDQYIERRLRLGGPLLKENIAKWFLRGGVHATMVGSLHPTPIDTLPFLSPHSTVVTFCEGVLNHATTWEALREDAEMRAIMTHEQDASFKRFHVHLQVTQKMDPGSCCRRAPLLSAFDEGKRSCRRKLESHNKRRRRRSIGLKDFATDGEGSKEDLLDDTNSDVEAQKGSEYEAVETVVSNTARDGETILASENCHGSPLSYTPCLQNNNSSSGVSFASSGNAQIDGGGNPKSTISSTNRSVYSSVCPTGRISFKLYDWNPAELLRRL